MTDSVAAAASVWNDALARWSIPSYIIDQAPASPWVHAPAMFRSGTDDPDDTPSMQLARQALRSGSPAGFTVLDVGCGGGRSSLPLVPDATSVIGVDHQRAMLDQFAAAGATRGVDTLTIEGSWPDAAGRTPSADVVVCHHVVYNVGDIEPFLRSLDDHAHRRVVVELTAFHPQSSLADLWRHFWHIERPTDPTADTFVDVVRAMGHEPTVVRWRRDERPAPMPRDQLVANIRQRLCLPAERDDEIADALGERAVLAPDEVVSVGWDVDPPTAVR